jgi:predicted nucleic acid-binding protein
MKEFVVDASVALKWFIYVALAIAQRCRLVTADQKLYNALQHSTYDKNLSWVGD